MAAKFEVYEDASGKHRSRLKSGNGQVVAQGEAYETKSATPTSPRKTTREIRRCLKRYIAREVYRALNAAMGGAVVA